MCKFTIMLSSYSNILERPALIPYFTPTPNIIPSYPEYNTLLPDPHIPKYIPSYSAIHNSLSGIDTSILRY